MNLYEAYQYLLEMVNREISYCLDVINNLKEDLELSYNKNWCKEIIRNENLKLKELIKVKRFLIQEKRNIKSIEQFVFNVLKKW